MFCAVVQVPSEAQMVDMAISAFGSHWCERLLPAPARAPRAWRRPGAARGPGLELYAAQRKSAWIWSIRTHRAMCGVFMFC
jgi:hypothetical protein